MKVMRLADSAQAPALVADDIPQPRPQRGELLIRVHAVGLTPTEPLWSPTTHTQDGGKRSGAIMGHEFSGVIAAVGEDAAGFEIGEEVYGMNDWFADGALAEYCVTRPGSVARKPSRLTHAEAASVPIAALTAWQGLVVRAKLLAGEHVLVHGGAGAVGSFAVQVARFLGARVTTTASAQQIEFVTDLGAEGVIDYGAVRFEERVSGMDVIFDTIGRDTLQRSWGVLKPGGRMVTIAADSEYATDERVKQAYFIVEPNHEQLVRIGGLLESGDLRPVVDTVMPIDQASAAFSGGVKERRGRGKLVATLIPDT
jgi:NADPH:quinone reductase-like Zn-dependent oxidoreductase